MRKIIIPLLLNFVTYIAISQDLDNTSALSLIRENANVLNINISGDDVPKISSAYIDAKRGITYIYIQQTYKDINVFNIVKSCIFKQNLLQYNSGDFIKSIATKAESAIPTIAAIDAVKQAAIHLQLAEPKNLVELENTFTINKKMLFSAAGIAKENIKTELVWVSKDDGKTVQLAWNVSIDVLNSADYWNVRINAFNGDFIEKDNYTVSEKANTNSTKPAIKKNEINEQKEESKIKNAVPYKLMLPPPTVTTATYNVIPYPYENRFVGSIALETDPWLKAGATNNATTNGWHFDGSTNYIYTRGNNVYAYDDSLNQNVPGRAPNSSTASPSLTFSTTPDFTQQPTTTINRRFATTNLFYWNNIIHDVFYQYGFDETAGNFQNDNMARGGIGGDYVRAEAQDGGGTNNANFYTYPDGGSARMQMYLYNPANDSLNISTPSTIAGNYFFKESNFSTNNKLKNIGTITGQVVYYNDNSTGTTHYACSSPFNNVSGKIALISAYNCSLYTTKIKNAQNAGAIAVIVYQGSGNPVVMGGSDMSITIPAVMISSADGAKIGMQLKNNIAVNVTLKSGIYFDGDIDNGIVSHEYAHGISIRLTGGPSIATCLSNTEQGGEGWSDYIGLMMTTNWGAALLSDGTKSRASASYVTNQALGGLGNRTYPYTTNMSVNPHTYTDISDTIGYPQYNSSGVKINNATEVHYIGEVWCSALWDMTWFIIQQDELINSNLYDASGIGGNIVALNLVIQGMKLQPCKPGFLDARNAILAADSIMYNSAYHAAIWKAFARRGMGYSALQGSSSSTTDQTPAFDMPPIISGRITTPTNKIVKNVNTIIGGDAVNVIKNNISGSYIFSCLKNGNYTIHAAKNNDITKANGINATDVLFVQRHILNTTKLNSAFKLIAADVNGDKLVNATDVLRIKRLILGTDTTFTKGSGANKVDRLWEFVDSAYTFPDTTNPFPFKDSISFTNLTSNKINQTFIGVKLGDVNDSWNAAVARSVVTKPVELQYTIDNKQLTKNNEELGIGNSIVRIPITVKNFKELIAMQYTLHFNNKDYEFVGIENNKLDIDFNSKQANQNGNISFLWTDKNAVERSLEDGTEIFVLVLRSTVDRRQSTDLQLTIDNSITEIAAWDKELNKHNIVISKKIQVETKNLDEYFAVSPNPTNGEVRVNIVCKVSKLVRLELSNVEGRKVFEQSIDIVKGTNSFTTNLKKKANLPTGFYYLKIVGLEGENVKKILVK